MLQNVRQRHLCKYLVKRFRHAFRNKETNGTRNSIRTMQVKQAQNVLKERECFQIAGTWKRRKQRSLQVRKESSANTIVFITLKFYSFVLLSFRKSSNKRTRITCKVHESWRVVTWYSTLSRIFNWANFR